jgi:glycosyltransferase involved in cell wall biosynthesis
MNAAIQYHPEAYTTTGPKLMGRHVAGQSFLRGFLTHSRCSEFWALVENQEHARQFVQTVSSSGRLEPVRTVDKTNLASLHRPGVVFCPGPGIGRQAFHRSAFGHGAWSLCGITHTTSSALAMDALADLITAPVQPWDAVICTSAAVKDNVTRLLQAQHDYLQDRLGTSKLTLPHLPVIPLGIRTQDFVFSASQKADARAALSVSAETLVVLFMGRLSFHAKAHPLSMYQALETAARATGKEVVLVECGWHANEFISKAYIDAASLACPSVRVVILDGKKAEDRQVAWAGADVFCSLSDNIQETFGLAPVEAMAAGLPVVVSDWDGYRDTVRDGIDGFRIPTLMPQPGLGADLALRHALEIDTYDMYCGYTCSLVAVDVQATAHAFVQLFNSPELRHRLGESGRRRAQEVYDWKPLIGQYEALWARLSEMRRDQAKDLKALAYPWPARMDPFHAFAGYATRALAPQTELARVDADVSHAVERALAYRQLDMVGFAKFTLPSEAEIRTLLGAVGHGATTLTARELLEPIPSERQGNALRMLSWLLKLGVLEVRS